MGDLKKIKLILEMGVVLLEFYVSFEFEDDSGEDMWDWNGWYFIWGEVICLFDVVVISWVGIGLKF